MLSPLGTKKPQVQLSDARRRDLFGKSKALMAGAQLFGIRRHFHLAASFWNIRELELYLADGITTWTEFCEGHAYSRQHISRYVKLGDALIKHVPRDENNPEEPFCFTLKSIDAISRDLTPQVRALSFKDLLELSKRIDTFEAVLKGADIPEEVLQHLLPESSRTVTKTFEQAVPRRAKVLAYDPTQEENGWVAPAETAELPAEFEPVEFKTPRRMAEEHGWIFDERAKAFKHQDGSDLSEAESALIVTEDAALRVWTQFEKASTDYRNTVHAIVKAEGMAFKQFLETRQNKRFLENAKTRQVSVAKVLSEMQRLADSLCLGNLDHIEDMRRHGIEEH